MANEWIKMRHELWSHPKFCRLVNHLTLDDASGGLLQYLFGTAHEHGNGCALRSVTEPALRDVTLCGLLRVWCAVNAHCRPGGNTDDVIFPDTRLIELDRISGIRGFGNAMQLANWVGVDDERNCLLFKDFLRFNEPAYFRSGPLTNAQRQKRHRDKERNEKHNDNVTARNDQVTQSNDREEKRRGSNKPTPNPSLEGGELSSAKRKTRKERQEEDRQRRTAIEEAKLRENLPPDAEILK